MALAFRKLRISALPCVGTGGEGRKGGISNSRRIGRREAPSRRHSPALKVTMHFRQANSVASRRICRNLVTTSWRAWISDMILVILWVSVLSVFMPAERSRAGVTVLEVRGCAFGGSVQPAGRSPETARRVVGSTGMAHCAMPKTNSSLQASSRRISCAEKGSSH